MIHGAGPRRENARPARAEAVGAEAQIAHQTNILAEPSVVVAGEVASRAIGNFARRVREAMPNAFPGAVRQRRAFDLVGACGCAPEEIRWKLVIHH